MRNFKQHGFELGLAESGLLRSRLDGKWISKKISWIFLIHLLINPDAFQKMGKQ